MDGWSWAEAAYQILGAAIAVALGYGVSEFFAWKRRNDELATVRASIIAEIQHNQALAQAVPLEARDLVTRPRPTFSTAARDTYFLRAPDALGAQELPSVLKFYASLETIVGVWDNLKSAQIADWTSAGLIASQPREIGLFAPPKVSGQGTNYLGNLARIHNVKLQIARQDVMAFQIAALSTGKSSKLARDRKRP